MLGWLRATVGALLPARCVGCEASIDDGAALLLCETCWASVKTNDGVRCARCDLPGQVDCCASRAFLGARAPFLYDSVLQDLVVAMKFGKREDVAWALGDELGRRVARPEAFSEALVMPVPLGKRRRRERGFNQSAVMARALANRWDLPVGFALTRARETLKQSDLPLLERRKNVAGAFLAKAAITKPVVLVDDVLTSGETAQAASEALLAAGAPRVFVVAAARTP